MIRVPTDSPDEAHAVAGRSRPGPRTPQHACGPPAETSGLRCGTSLRVGHISCGGDITVLLPRDRHATLDAAASGGRGSRSFPTSSPGAFTAGRLRARIGGDAAMLLRSSWGEFRKLRRKAPPPSVSRARASSSSAQTGTLKRTAPTAARAIGLRPAGGDGPAMIQPAQRHRER